MIGNQNLHGKGLWADFQVNCRTREGTTEKEEDGGVKE